MNDINYMIARVKRRKLEKTIEMSYDITTEVYIFIKNVLS